ncbi:uncharacterized protein LOC125213021 [Salvia hispanica]|uniref:uncharacterized protein LOC125213021 n=1 Tax=Salvia hispanica TaxID=49212 RepID=UPI002008F268|nr:uncharacterized protein LOC125213021 [Salvia hispanica]XP_047969321.1 uncharacterized protein LOC125213021 [Salvia hispanica]XP_047969322.1 uncharacterized protein LOC125213021 [Salvia hispanica]XP_047969323.1 uncharacterized protein LOC125213021 [Salvia hispanica]XP_047969324.1 uncharacterized protein LOC125213021 [Salvia hispanica]XP_047969325.1 uncharacterized protein LOC125213021 [Salvia hispanica]
MVVTRKGDGMPNDLTTVLILLEEVIRNYQINMLLISFMITLICPQTRKRKRPSTRVSRKLFDGDIACFLDLSTRKSASRANVGGTVILSSLKGSSCASWSPVPTLIKQPRRVDLYWHI